MKCQTHRISPSYTQPFGVNITVPGYVLEFSKYWVNNASNSSYWIRASECRPRDSYKIAISSCNMKKLQKLQLGLFRASRSLSDWKILFRISRFWKFEKSWDSKNFQMKLIVNRFLSNRFIQLVKSNFHRLQWNLNNTIAKIRPTLTWFWRVTYWFR